ncbi:MAG: DUF423 domain-containing protein [Ignavibacteria bacterium]|nr:DUF423 domain-containing protein [Ignavibacteria bacterium]
MSKSRKWIITGSVFGFLGVAIGALGAHALKPMLNPETSETFRTGVFYHIVHSLAILAIGLSSREYLLKACRFFLAGIILFSFSLYPYSLTHIKFLAMITPFGGVAFLIGWLTVIVAEVKNKGQNGPSGI